MRRRSFLAGSAYLTAGAMLPGCSSPSNPDVLRLATVKFGSLNWLVQTILSRKLDDKAGFKLETLEVANNQGGPVALLADEADIVVSDWPWAMRQRSLGENLYFSPYSQALGGIIVDQDSTITKLADMKGKRLGVAGSSIDKSWLLLRAYAKKVTGEDMADLAEPVFGSPPLLSEEFKSGRIDGVLNFWTYTARLIGEGHRQLIGMDEILAGLDVAPVPSLVGFVWKDTTQKTKADQIAKFFETVRGGNDVLASSDEAWNDIRKLVRPKTDAEFAAIKKAYRDGIPNQWSSAQTASAQKLFDLLVSLGDKSLVGHGTKFDPELFKAVG